MAGSKMIVFLCMVALTVQQSQAIKCYVCNSAINAGCEDIEVPAKYLVTCDPSNAKAIEPPHVHSQHVSNLDVSRTVPFAPVGSNFTYCRKTAFNVPVQMNGDASKGPSNRIERSCGYLDKDATNSCKWQTSFGGIQVYTCQCEGDHCNSAPSWGISIFSLAAIQIAAVFIKNNLVN